jgi:bifunctional UDP-N-acetylglucosamine pyrophosphorylase/glucosamine-1-phosphate N-acetyltransferase
VNKTPTSIIILAAGKGTRMKSSLPKVLHKIANREMLNLVIDTAKELNPIDIIIVISKEMQQFVPIIKKEHPKINLNFVIQEQQIGTADAVLTGIKSLSKISETVLVLYGDTPLIKAKTLELMINNPQQKNSVCVLGFDCDEENKYGRLIVKNNQLIKIVEFKEASTKEQELTFCNSGVMAIDGAKINSLLAKINNKNTSGEFYLTDIISIARTQNLDCGFIKTNKTEVLGVNSRAELAKIEKIKQKEIKNQLMENGVTMHDPKSIYFSFDTKISNDVIIHPNVVFGCGVKIDSNVEIKSFSHIEGAKIESGAVIGPFARIRPKTTIGQNVRIGNFVEIKKSIIKKDTKINHLSYIGDANIGEKTNVGAGTITCNYDGYKKHQTKIGKKVFIGSNTSLIAPINIEDDTIIGAGSVIIDDVKNGDLAISRTKQQNIKNGGNNYHHKKQKNLSK